MVSVFSQSRKEHFTKCENGEQNCFRCPDIFCCDNMTGYRPVHDNVLDETIALLEALYGRCAQYGTCTIKVSEMYPDMKCSREKGDCVVIATLTKLCKIKRGDKHVK